MTLDSRIEALGNLRTVESLEDVPPGHGVMEIMERRGDLKKIWDPRNETEVEDARRSFHALRKDGYAAFHVNDDEKGSAGSQMHSFDPDAGRMIMRPAMQGG